MGALDLLLGSYKTESTPQYIYEEKVPGLLQKLATLLGASPQPERKYTFPTEGQDIKTTLPTPSPTPQPKSQSVLGDYTMFPGLSAPTPPKDLSDLILKAANENGINPSLFAALLFQESGYRPDAIGQTDQNDIGIGQINLKSHPDVSREQALDPNFAIPWSAKLLRDNIEHFGDINRGIAAYNVGRGGASIEGPEEFGGGPKGQMYINNVARNLSEELIRELGLKVGSQ